MSLLEVSTPGFQQGVGGVKTFGEPCTAPPRGPCSLHLVFPAVLILSFPGAEAAGEQASFPGLLTEDGDGHPAQAAGSWRGAL